MLKGVTLRSDVIALTGNIQDLIWRSLDNLV